MLDAQVYEPECYDLAEEDMDELFGDTTETEFSLEGFIDDETFILEVTLGGRVAWIWIYIFHIHVSLQGK